MFAHNTKIEPQQERQKARDTERTTESFGISAAASQYTDTERTIEAFRSLGLVWDNINLLLAIYPGMWSRGLKPTASTSEVFPDYSKRSHISSSDDFPPNVRTKGSPAYHLTPLSLNVDQVSRAGRKTVVRPVMCPWIYSNSSCLGLLP